MKPNECLAGKSVGEFVSVRFPVDAITGRRNGPSTGLLYEVGNGVFMMRIVGPDSMPMDIAVPGAFFLESYVDSLELINTKK